MNHFDAFMKPHNEFRVRTAVGGYLTVGAIVLCAILFVTELNFFLELESKDIMAIDKNQDRKLFTYNLVLTTPAIPCAAIAINVADVRKLNVMRLHAAITKKRILPSRKRSPTIVASLENVVQSPTEMRDVLTEDTGAAQNWESSSTVRSRCPSCFDSDAFSFENRTEHHDSCCRTCKDVKEANLRRKNERLPPSFIYEQCAAESYASYPLESDEGCALNASITLHKKPIVVSIGLPTKITKNSLHPDFERKILTGVLNWTHTIDAVSFGAKIPGIVSVLDNRTAVQSDNDDRRELDVNVNVEELHSQFFEYNIRIIPTTYVPVTGEEQESHQYSVTNYTKRINLYTERPQATMQLFGGIQFEMSFTPFQVSWIKSRKKWLHFLTECCAIVGGIIAFSTMVDNLSYRFSTKLTL